jgi:hypothetical protein
VLQQIPDLLSGVGQCVAVEVHDEGAERLVRSGPGHQRPHAMWRPSGRHLRAARRGSTWPAPCRPGVEAGSLPGGGPMSAPAAIGISARSAKDVPSVLALMTTRVSSGMRDCVRSA